MRYRVPSGQLLAALTQPCDLFLIHAFELFVNRLEGRFDLGKEYILDSTGATFGSDILAHQPAQIEVTRGECDHQREPFAIGECAGPRLRRGIDRRLAAVRFCSL
jgi:hypothetical protein